VFFKTAPQPFRNRQSILRVEVNSHLHVSTYPNSETIQRGYSLIGRILPKPVGIAEKTILFFANFVEGIRRPIGLDP
jgi:hypothetical protein